VVAPPRGVRAAEAPRRTFAAACPKVSREIPRKPGPMRVMFITAHPDDADIRCGCLAAKLVDKGYEVKFVAVADGRFGHQRLTPEETARTRRAETLEAAKRLKLHSYDIYGLEGTSFVSDGKTRRLMATKIREFAPDVIVTHRTCDYHVDHRMTGMIVQDVGYMLGVPHWAAEAPALRRRPVIFVMSDEFTVPRELRPDGLVDCTPYMGRWCDALDAQVSQFYDWLPWDKGVEAEVRALGDRSDIAARDAYLKKYWAKRKKDDAARFSAAWQAQHPGKPVPEYVESYEISEYGRAPTEEDLDRLFGDK